MKKSHSLLISLYGSFLLLAAGGADFSIAVSPSSVSTQVGETTSPVG